MSLLDKLKEMIPDEIIDGSNVDETAEMVDLDVAYKLFLVPDVVHSDDFEIRSNIPNVVEATTRPDGKYQYSFQTEAGPDFKILTIGEAKIMRARFLLLKGFYATNMDSLSYPKQQEAASKYDIHFIPDIFKQQS